MSASRASLRIVLPLLFLALGGGSFGFLMKTRPSPERATQEERGVLVEVIRAEQSDEEVRVHAQGTVLPARQVTLRPEVGGRVIWQHDQLVPGGRFAEGEPMLRVDPRDYKLAFEAGQAQVSKAALDLELERSRQEIAQKEWKLFGGEPTPTSTQRPDGGTLALRDPQVRTARVAVQSAQSSLKKARVDLQRTTLTAPFNSLVVQESSDLGQVLSPQAPVATVVGTDQFWVQVSLPVASLSSIDIPGIGGATEGSFARVWKEVGAEQIEREGRVERLLVDLDAVGTMARVLVTIDDPLGLRREHAGLPLLLNSYVHVELDARPIRNVFKVPRVALREGDSVYVYADGKLDIREAFIAWKDQEFILIAKGLEAGDMVITTPIPTPVDGMQLRLAEHSPDKAPTVAKAKGKPKLPAEATP